MKINPPKAIIGKEDPFEHALFGRKEFAESLTSLLRNVEENLVIFVNAPWGGGKTTFAEMWKTQLEKRDHLNVIYFDAYAADYFDDPFVSFSGEILDFADKHLPDGKKSKERREFKKTAIEVGKRLVGLATKVGIRAATLNVVDEKHMGEMKDIGSEIIGDVSEISADFIEKRIEKYGEEKNALLEFKTNLKMLAAKVREKQKFPLTIIVDELDRCRPDFALGLLERIKHLFNVEGVTFILLVNRSQIESYIRTVYGNVDADAYLLKFGSLFIDLPNRQPLYSFQYVSGRKEYCNRLLYHYELSQRVPDGGFLATCVGILAKHFDLTLREIEKVFAIMALYYGSLQTNQFANPFLVATLSVLKVKDPSLYQSLSKGNISADQFYKHTGINQMEVGSGEGFNFDWAKDMLDYCLMSDMEFQIATSEGNTNVRKGLADMGRWVGSNRQKVIPALCWRLDRFSLLPRTQ